MFPRAEKIKTEAKREINKWKGTKNEDSKVKVLDIKMTNM
jgi:hypothetical protein